MKRFISLSLAAAMAVTVLGSNVASAQPYQGPPPGHPGGPGGGPPGHDHPPHGGPGWHEWHHGDHYSGNRYVVNNWHHYRLRPPPRGYEWVQNGGQFVLIAVATGVVTEIILTNH